MIRTLARPLCLCAVLAGPAAAEEHAGVNWQDAVAELAAERSRAEGCVSLAKQTFVTPGPEIGSVQLDYGEAKSQMDAIVGALVVVLAREGAPADFATLETRLAEAVALREGICSRVMKAMFKHGDEQTKGLLTEIVGKGVAAMITAIKDIYVYHQEEDVLERKTIQTQVEATRWRDFADIPG